jgi:hypothetical protein
MQKCELIGLEVNTPDGRGCILSLHPKKVVVSINYIVLGQIMKGIKRDQMHYAYNYEDVEIIKGRYAFKE